MKKVFNEESQTSTEPKVQMYFLWVGIKMVIKDEFILHLYLTGGQREDSNEIQRIQKVGHHNLSKGSLNTVYFSKW